MLTVRLATADDAPPAPPRSAEEVRDSDARAALAAGRAEVDDAQRT